LIDVEKRKEKKKNPEEKRETKQGSTTKVEASRKHMILTGKFPPNGEKTKEKKGGEGRGN